MINAKISVIIPCYNVGNYIDRCMASIAVQTLGVENLEIIFIDDASTDDTWERLQRWEKRFPDNVYLIRQNVNRRQGAARNVGLQYASADYIAFVDSDDWLEPDYFEQLYWPAVQYCCDVVFCGWNTDLSDSLTYFEKNEGVGNEYFIADTEEKKKIWIKHRILGNLIMGKIIRRSIITDNQIFFPEELVYEDMYWMPLLHVYALNAYKVGKNLYHYFINNTSTLRLKNSDHHLDWITIQLMKWNDYSKRGLMEKYRNELELDALRDAALFMKMFVKWYDFPSYSVFQLEREVIQQHVSENRGKIYLKNRSKEFVYFGEALYRPMDRIMFEIFVAEARNYER
jgi:glycosyltransferase involved in cell wall biosynthesis